MFSAGRQMEEVAKFPQLEDPATTWLKNAIGVLDEKEDLQEFCNPVWFLGIFIC